MTAGCGGCRCLPPPARCVAPGHSRRDGSRSALAERAEGERVAAREGRDPRRLADEPVQALGRPVQVALDELLAVDRDLHDHGLRVDLVGRHDARSEREREPFGRGERVAAGPVRRPVVHQRVAEDVRSDVLARCIGRLEPQDGGDLRLVVDPGGVGRPRHVLLGADDAALDARRVGHQQGRGEERREDPCLFDDVVRRLVSFEGGTGGVHHGPAAARHQGFQGGGEGGVPDHVGQIDYLTPEDRSQSPVPPPVIGHEPHQGAEAYARPPAISGFRPTNCAVTRGLGADPERPWLSYGRHHQQVFRPRHRTERGDAPMAEKFRVTYATMSADNEELQASTTRPPSG